MKNKKKNGLLGAVSITVYFAVGIILGLSADMEISMLEEPIRAMLILSGAVLASIYAQVIVHESGHLIFGLLSGYKFSSFRIGVFTLMKSENDRFCLKLMRVPGTAGQCLLAPPEPVNGMIPHRLYNMGGVIMNIVISAVILVLKISFGVKGAGGLFLLTLTLMGLALAITNGIPMRSKLICNDGMNALYANDPSSNRAFYNTLKIAWYQSKGYRMKDMPSEIFRFPDSEGLKNPLIASEAVFMIERVMDSGYLGEASDLIDITLRDGEALNGLYTRLLKSDRLYVSLMAGREVSYIESLLDKEMIKLLKALPNAMFGIYTVYAYEKLYKGNLEKADKLRQSFSKRSRSFPYRGEMETVQALMDRVDAQWDFWNRA